MTTEKRGRGRPRKHFEAVNLETVAAEIAPLRTEAETRLAQLQAFPLDTKERVDLFGQLLADVRGQRDALEAQRTSITKPLNDAKRAVDALFKPMKDLFDAMERTINERLNAYLQSTRQAQTAALAAVGDGVRDAGTLAVAHATPAVPEALIEVADYELVVENESLIPRPFLVFDEALALKYVRHMKGNCEIPGVKILKRSNFRRAAT